MLWLRSFTTCVPELQEVPETTRQKYLIISNCFYIEEGFSMKDFTGLELCNDCSKRVDIHVRASLRNGELTVSGQDLGPYVEEFWGDSDYEYWYSFDRQNTETLFRAIDGTDDPEKALLKRFGGKNGCMALRNFCKQNKIKYDFFSYA